MSDSHGSSIAAIILAAGASRRLGEPKQLLRLNGETLLARAIRTAREAGCSPILVVVGAEYPQILGNCALGHAIPVINDRWQEGMASSIVLGVRALGFLPQKVEGAVLMVCDQPAVTPEHLGALASAAALTASSYAGRKGVPAYFPSKVFPELAKLTGDAGARELLRDAPAVELSGGELDIDTAAERAEAEWRFG